MIIFHLNKNVTCEQLEGQCFSAKGAATHSSPPPPARCYGAVINKTDLKLQVQQLMHQLDNAQLMHESVPKEQPVTS